MQLAPVPATERMGEVGRWGLDVGFGWGSIIFFIPRHRTLLSVESSVASCSACRHAIHNAPNVTKKSNYAILSVLIATINLGGNLLPRTGEGDLGSPNVWGYVLSYLSTVVYHNANANINSHNPVYI